MGRVHSRMVGRQLVSGVAAVFVVVLAGVIAGSQPTAPTDDYGYDPNYLNAAAARRSRHLVFLDRRQREVLGRDGPSHRRQRQPAQLSSTRAVTAGASASWARSRSRAAKRRPARTSTGSGWIAAIRPPVPGVPGEASGIVGLRKFPNPKFDRRASGTRPSTCEHPGRHAAAVPGRHDLRLLPHRLQPDQPARRSRAAGLGEPGRHHRQPVLGRRKAVQPQHEAGRLPVARGRAAAAGHVGHVAVRDRSHQQPERDQHDLQPVGPADRARAACATARRPPVHHILKDGADSIGVAGASLRVYVNIGMCGDYWVTLHDPVLGIARQAAARSTSITRARTARTGGNTEARMANAEAFLKTDEAAAAEGRAGRRAVPDGVGRHAHDRPARVRGELRAVPFEQAAARGHGRSRCSGSARRSQRHDFLTDNFLSDDKRYSITQIGTNVARVAGQQRHPRQHLGQVLVGNLQGAAERRHASPTCTTRAIPTSRSPSRCPAAAAATIRTASLTSIWATAPYLHNNSVGRVRQGSVGAGPHDGVQRRHAEDALARTPAGRAVDSGDDRRQLACTISGTDAHACASPPARRSTTSPASIRRGCPTSSATASLLNLFSDEASTAGCCGTTRRRTSCSIAATLRRRAAATPTSGRYRVPEDLLRGAWRCLATSSSSRCSSGT